MDKSIYNKISKILIGLGVIWIVAVFSYAMLIPCSHPNKFCFYCSGDCFGLMGVLIFGVWPAAFLGIIALILFLVYKFKK